MVQCWSLLSVLSGAMNGPVCPPAEGVVMRKSSSTQRSAVVTPRAQNNTERSGSALEHARVEINKLKTTKKSRRARNAELAAALNQPPDAANGNDQPANIGSAEETQLNESRLPTYSRTPRSAPVTRTANANQTVGTTGRERRAGPPNRPTSERTGRRHADLLPQRHPHRPLWWRTPIPGHIAA